MIDEKDKSIKLKLRFISYKLKYRKARVAVKRKITDTFNIFNKSEKAKLNSVENDKGIVDEKRLPKNKQIKEELDDKKVVKLGNKKKETKSEEKVKISNKNSKVDVKDNLDTKLNKTSSRKKDALSDTTSKATKKKEILVDDLDSDSKVTKISKAKVKSKEKDVVAANDVKTLKAKEKTVLADDLNTNKKKTTNKKIENEDTTPSKVSNKKENLAESLDMDSKPTKTNKSKAKSKEKEVLQSNETTTVNKKDSLNTSSKKTAKLINNENDDNTVADIRAKIRAEQNKTSTKDLDTINEVLDSINKTVDSNIKETLSDNLNITSKSKIEKNSEEINDGDKINQDLKVDDNQDSIPKKEKKSLGVSKAILFIFKGILLVFKFILSKFWLLIKTIVKFVGNGLKNFIHSFDFSNMKGKLKKAFLVCFALSIIGVATYSTRRMLNAPSALTKRYYLEIANDIGIDYSNIVKIIKADINSDGVDDYVCLNGECVYGTTKAYVGNDNLTGYKNVGIICIDGVSKAKITYESEFLFYTDVNIKVLNDTTGTYIFVNSITSQDVIFVKFTNDGLFDIIKNSFDSLPKGYNISCRISEEDNKKLIIAIDREDNDYLADKKDEYVVDLEQKGINMKSYRYSYLKDKFSYFECYDIDYDGNLELIGIQNILYSNSKFTSSVKTVGKLKVIFKLSGDKIVYSDSRMEF